MTIEVKQGKQTHSIVLADSIRDLSAARYLLFNQAWVREVGVGGDFYGTESHLARIGVFLRANNLAAVAGEYNNLLLHLQNLTSSSPQHLQAAVLAPLVVSINAIACHDTSEAGLLATATAVLATGLTQAQLTEAVEQSKKNFNPS